MPGILCWCSRESGPEQEPAQGDGGRYDDQDDDRMDALAQRDAHMAMRADLRVIMHGLSAIRAGFHGGADYRHMYCMGSKIVGYGDEIMAAGHAEAVFRRDPSRQVAICDRSGAVRWHELWRGNPAIAASSHQNERLQRITNAVGCRPYIQYPFTARSGIRFTEWRARDHVGTLYLTEAERDFGRALRAEIGPFIVLEPGVKALSTPNKLWGLSRFEQVVAEMIDVQFVRVSWDEPRPFRLARHVSVRSFREACAIIAASDGYVGTEGGYHHAAAVLRKPGVVIFGGFISPKTTGYPWHTNIADKGPGSPCGRWRPCGHCQRAMGAISVEQVVAAVRAMVGRQEVSCQ